MKNKTAVIPLSCVLRYGNRRLYCRREGAYITMEEIERRIRAGQPVTVLQYNSNGNHPDVTRYVLLSILAQHAQAGRCPADLGTLCNLIRNCDAGPVFNKQMRAGAASQHLRS